MEAFQNIISIIWNNSKEAPKGFHSWMEVEGLKIAVHLKQHTYTDHSTILLPGGAQEQRD